MRTLACLRAGTLIDRRGAGLTDPERLVLEEHLGSCADCRSDAGLLEAVVRIAAVETTPSTGGTFRAHTIERALARAPARRQSLGWRAGALPREWPAPAHAAAAGVLLLLGLGAVWLFRSGAGGAGGAAGGTTVTDVSATATLVGGDLRAGGRALVPGEVLAPGAEATSPSGAVVSAAHGRVELRAGTTIAWEGESRRLALAGGSVRVSVEPSGGRSFSVATPHFVAHVVGTVFAVEAEGVTVERGTVRVTALDGSVLADALGPGARWRFTPVVAAATTLARPIETPDAVGPRLERARRALAAGEVPGARVEILAVLATLPAPPPPVEAEARSLLAECALVGGDTALAARLYAEVAERFVALPAGETALFAAARLEATAGRVATARALLTRYTEQYPDGRFLEEALARLRALGGR